MSMDWLVGSSSSPQRPIAELPRRAARDVAAPPSFGDVIAGRYMVEARIGRGGAGVVYRGLDLQDDVAVALKVLWRKTEASAETLRLEAATHMGLRHPHIVSVQSYLTFPRYDVMVMSLAPGGDLQRLRRSRPDEVLTEDEAVSYCMELLDALAYIHGRGILHNDIKPQNLLLGEDNILKLCDFGAAVRASRVTKGMSMPGTYAYSSPERLQSLPPDPRSDIYSVGATLYTLLHGRAPFGSLPETAVYGHLDKPVPRSERIPGPLYDVIARAMEKSPDARFPSALAMRQGLEALGYTAREVGGWSQPPVYDVAADGVPTLDVRAMEVVGRARQDVLAPRRAAAAQQSQRRAPVGTPGARPVASPSRNRRQTSPSGPGVRSQSRRVAASLGGAAPLGGRAGSRDPELTAPSTRATMKSQLDRVWEKPQGAAATSAAGPSNLPTELASPMSSNQSSATYPGQTRPTPRPLSADIARARPIAATATPVDMSEEITEPLAPVASR